MGEHINGQGEFQSDKYSWCPAGFVPLKLTDPMARPVLWDYARRREAVDKEFSEDLRTCLIAAGHLAPSAVPDTPSPSTPCPPPTDITETGRRLN